MLIKNAMVFNADKSFSRRNIRIEKGRFAEGDAAEEIIDAAGCFALPGLIDLHFHGAMGYDFCDNSRTAIAKIAEYEAAHGVTAIAPATMTLPVEELEDILATAAAYTRESASAGADLVGINMEGPFISKVKKGAQDDHYIIPCDVPLFHRFQAAAEGLVKFMGIAPEEGEALDFIAAVKDEVNVSLAHTNASYEVAKAAFDQGANHAVHLYNAMPPFTHRAPGVVGAVVDSEQVMAELICDGVHIHPAVVRATFKMLGEDRLILISDSMRATGLANGEYTLGGLAVNVAGKRATLVSDGALAGSVTNLFDCLKTAVMDMEIPLETAVACATINPARSLGIETEYGSIEAGKRANVVLVDQELNIIKVIKDGKIIRQ